MPSKKDNLPLNVEKDIETTGPGTITYANEVIAIIAGVATSEVEGIAGMSASGGFPDILGRNRNITKGVKVELGTEETSVDLYIIVEYGTPIQKAAHDAQENVRKAIESMTGLRVVRVDVHVQGVSFEKENKALEKGMESAALASGEVFHKVTAPKVSEQEAAPVPPAKVELVEDVQDRSVTEPEGEKDALAEELDRALEQELNSDATEADEEAAPSVSEEEQAPQSEEETK